MKLRRLRKRHSLPQNYFVLHRDKQMVQRLLPAVADDPEDTYVRALEAEEGAEPGPTYINPDLYSQEAQ